MYRYIDFFDYSIPTYGLCMSLAFIICGLLVVKASKKEGLEFNDIIIVIAASIGTALISANLLYIAITYSLNEIIEFIKAKDFSFAFNGGIVFYGGLLGGIAGGFMTAKILKIRIDTLAICIVPYIPLGHAIGRIGCMLSGCCHGFMYDGIFAVTNNYTPIPGEYFPIQAMEAFVNLIIMSLLLLYSKKAKDKRNILYIYLFMYSVMRFIIEFFRGDLIRGSIWGLSTSQCLSLVIFLFCILRVLFCNLREKKYISY